MKHLKVILVFTLLLTVLLSACQPAEPAPVEETSSELPLFFGAYATAIEEPWDGVIHQALLKASDEGKIKI